MYAEEALLLLCALPFAVRLLGHPRLLLVLVVGYFALLIFT